jgi:AraC-like DNA-binding protein
MSMEMDISNFEDIFPFVRMMRVKKSFLMTGKWKDLDHVYTYIMEGKAKFVIDGRSHDLNKGDAIIIPPYATHVITQQVTGPMVQYIFHFDLYETPDRINLVHKDILNETLKMILPDREKKLQEVFVTSFQETARIRIQKLYTIMLREFEKKLPGWGTLIRAYCMEILLLTLRNGQSGNIYVNQGVNKTKAWLHLENALEYINKNYYKDNSMNNVSIGEAVGVSPNYLTKIFIEYLGFTLHQYVTNFRIEKAQQLLISGKYNITEVSEKTGFLSLYVFSKVFKSVLGITPSEFISINIGREKFAFQKDLDIVDRLSNTNNFYHE